MKPLVLSTNTKGTLKSPVTIAIVAHLQANGPSKQIDLDRALVQVDGYGQNADPARLGRVLHKLREAGHVHRVLRGDEMLWVHGPHPQAMDAAAEEEVTPEFSAVAQSPRYDLLRCSLYVPEAGPTLRPGALDFKRIATVGLRC